MTARAETSTKGGRTAAKRRERKGGVIVRTTFAFFISLGFLLPVIWVAAAAFTPNGLIFQGLSHPSWSMLVPQEPTLDNFHQLTEFNFWKYLWNSLVVTGVSI